MDAQIIQENAKSKRRQVGDLEKMVGYGSLSEAGKNWLIQAIDPFHDSEVPVTGYPDMVTTPSVCQAIRQSVSVSVPSTVTTGTWDCNITAFPCPFASATTGLAINVPVPGVYQSNGATTNPYVTTGVTSFSGPSGTQGYGTTSANWKLTGGVAIPNNFTSGAMRVVGYGVEIVNTTSALNSQGLCTVWRQSCPVRNYVTVGFDRQTAVTAPTSWSSAYEFPQPPGSLASALLLEGSRQWHAKEGAYLVNTLADISNPPQQAEPVYVTSISSENQANSNGPYTGVTSAASNQYGTTATYMPAPTMTPPYHMVGAYFTGLSLQTTLTINTIWYVERFPTPFDNDLVVLTRPSPPFDPMAMELYGRSLQSMPAGVMVKENPFGEWFQDLIHNIAQAAAPALKAASIVPGYGPAFGMAGGVADIIAKSTARNVAAAKATTKQKARKRRQGVSPQPAVQPKPLPQRKVAQRRRVQNPSMKSNAPGLKMKYQPEREWSAE